MLCFLSNTESASLRRQHKVTCHAINKRFAHELTLLCFCWSYVLLLLCMKLLEFAQFLIMDVLHHHEIMMDIFHSQNIFWHTDKNPFNVLYRENMFDTPTFTQSNKAHLIACLYKAIISVSRSIMLMFHDNSWVVRNLMQNI